MLGVHDTTVQPNRGLENKEQRLLKSQTNLLSATLLRTTIQQLFGL